MQNMEINIKNKGQHKNMSLYNIYKKLFFTKHYI